MKQKEWTVDLQPDFSEALDTQISHWKMIVGFSKQLSAQYVKPFLKSALTL